MKFTSLLVFLLITSGIAKGQCNFSSEEERLKCPNTIISAVPFLRIVPDARSAAMGDAGVATSADANSMHHNASKLAFIESDLGLAASYSPWLRSLGLQDVYMAYLAGYKRLNEFQTLGASLRYFALGDLQFTDINGGSLGVGRPNEFEIAVAYARKLSENFSAGLTGKFIYSNLAGGQQIDNVDIVAATAGAVDISFTYQKPLNNGTLRIGTAFSNIGSKVSYTKSQFKDFIPGNFALGGALELDLDDYNQLTFVLDFNKLLVPTPIDDSDPDFDANMNGFPDYREKSLFEGVFGSFGDAPGGLKEELREIMYSFGAEYWYNKQFAFRAGYYYEHPTKGNRQFLTAGLGLKYNVFGLNVSYLVPTSNQRSPLDNTLRFTLVFHLDEKPVVVEEPNE
ncbi:MAG TPA: type IX secretion system outer membrane channel protein PorV [Saprospiraceae bacterium]|nr:type IX secretion system outer membrane channel protein PorV [Saprospiraceae bacterium]